MKKATVGVVLVMAMGVLGVNIPAQAHPYMVGDNWPDYLSLGAQAQGILDAMMTQYAGCNLWSTSCNGQTAIWTSVMGQRGPAWAPVGGYTADHGANRSPGWGPEPTFVRSDYHWAFLEEALKPGACLDGVAPARVQDIRNAFNHNKNRVLSTEITVYGVRVRASVLGCGNDHTRNVTTGGSISLPISAGTPFCPTVYTVNENVPSLFGTAHGGPMLNEAHPQLRDMLANMTAAYMTIGDSRVVDYWYAFMGRIGLTFVSELLPGLLAGIGKENPEKLEDPAFVIADAMFQALREITLIPDKSDKAPCQPWGNVPGVNVNIPVSGLPVVGSININVSITDSNVCLTLRNFADTFNCSGYACRPDYLAVKPTQGDLNADGTRNLSTWFQANQNLQEWKVLEGAGGYLDITLQPQAPINPVNYGAQHTYSANGVSSVPITYQWFAGYAPGALTPVSGATTRDFTPIMDVYSFGGTNMNRYYRVELSAFYCGVPNTVASQVIEVRGGNPPGIEIFEHPQSGNYYPGEAVTLSVNAGATAGPGVTFQWQKFNTGTSTWDNLPGKTTAVLAFPVIQPGDAGQYRARVFNQVAPSPLYWRDSNAATLTVAPVIVIDPQPQGAELTLGASHTMTIGATVAQGALEYRWQVNKGFGFQNLTGWGSQTSWAIASAQIDDAGAYRCLVRNYLMPFGFYQASSDVATIAISSGTVYRVDQTAPGPVHDGLTWETAFTTLQPAVTAAAGHVGGGGEVWVAGGPVGAPVVYNEARTEFWGGADGQPGRVQGSLVMKTNVRMYGGFEGYRGGAGAKEQYRQQRVLAQNIAVIDGSIARGGSPAYHVIVFGRGGVPTTNAAVDGFTITGGNASGVAGDYHTWRGGGIYNWLSAPTIANCRIVGNSAAVAGGGIANEGSKYGVDTYYHASATIVNCIIENNHVARSDDGYSGSIIPPWYGAPPTPLRGGGGVFNNRANPLLRFVTVRNNTLGPYTPPADDAENWGVGTGGMLSWAVETTPSVQVVNSIFWGNAEGAIRYGGIDGSVGIVQVDYTHIQGGWSGLGGNNSAVDPLLDAQGIPQTGSTVINTGDPAVPTGEYTDIRGVPRPIGPRVDRGAMEVSLNGPVPACSNTWLDFIATPKITDVFEVFNANDTISEVPIWKIQLQNKTFDCNSIPEDSIQVTVTDILGRSASCVSEVFVRESQPPTAVVNPRTIHLGPSSGQYTLDEDDVLDIGELSYDNCYVTRFSVVPSYFRCSQAGRNVFVTLLVWDNSGNASNISTMLQIRDVTPPSAVCGAIDVELDQFGRYELQLTDLIDLAAGSSDNCGIAWGFTQSNIVAPFSCVDVGPKSVTVTLVDNHGNESQCVGVVNVLDVTPPVIHGARGQSFSAFEGDYSMERALQGVTAEDICSGDLEVQVQAFDADDMPVAFPIPHDYDTGGLFQYAFTLRYTAQDASGNEAAVETLLNLYDLQLPEITLNGEALVVVECGDEYIDPGATAVDPATLEDLTGVMETVVAVDKDTPGDYAVTYYIMYEEYGLYVQEQRVVRVEDSLKPVITLVGDTLIGIQQGTVFTEPGYTAVDYCVGDLTSQVIVAGAVDPGVAGEYILSYDVGDGVQAAETRTRRVLVGDLIAFEQHPQGARLYTTSPAHTLSAVYVNGLFVDGHEWYRDLVGLGVEDPQLEGNSVTLTVNPAEHALGGFDYQLKVYDALGTHASNTARVEVAMPLAATVDLQDVELLEGDEFNWTVAVEGGLGARQFQWYRLDVESKGWMPVANGFYPHPTLGPGKYAGATTAALAFAPYTESMAGQYQLEVSDDFTTLVMGPATVMHGHGVPAASAVALAAMALATALGGAVTLRRRR